MMHERETGRSYAEESREDSGRARPRLVRWTSHAAVAVMLSLLMLAQTGAPLWAMPRDEQIQRLVDRMTANRDEAATSIPPATTTPDALPRRPLLIPDENGNIRVAQVPQLGSELTPRAQLEQCSLVESCGVKQRVTDQDLEDASYILDYALEATLPPAWERLASYFSQLSTLQTIAAYADGALLVLTLAELKREQETLTNPAEKARVAFEACGSVWRFATTSGTSISLDLLAKAGVTTTGLAQGAVMVPIATAGTVVYSMFLMAEDGARRVSVGWDRCMEGLDRLAALVGDEPDPPGLLDSIENAMQDISVAYENLHALATEPVVVHEARPITKGLTAGSVDPGTGTLGDEFTYEVTYTNPSGRWPRRCDVVVNGSRHTMTNRSEGGTPHNGLLYRYSTSRLDVGQDSYHFEFATSRSQFRYPESGELEGPTITKPSFLFDGTVSPQSGTEDGEFTYEVTYKHPDGAPPKWIVARIDGGRSEGGHSPSMYKVSGDFRNGAVYKATTALEPGSHTFSFRAKLIDDSYDTYPGSGELSGPQVAQTGALCVNLIPQYPEGQNSFEVGDDPVFEARIATPDGEYVDPDDDEGGYLMLSVWRYPPGQFVDVIRTKLGVGRYELHDHRHTFGNTICSYTVQAKKEGYYRGSAIIEFEVGDVPTVTPIQVTDLACDPGGIEPGVETTDISYAVSDPCALTLNIFADQRSPVRSLVDSPAHPAGDHLANWDARNDSGQLVPDGEYEARIRAWQVETMEGSGSFGPRGDGQGQLDRPVDVALFGNKAYVADEDQRKVAVYNTNGQHLSDITAEDIPKDSWYPQSVDCGPDGTVYVLDDWNSQLPEIMVFDPDDTYSHAFARGDFINADDGVIDADIDGNVYVGDWKWVREYDADGTFIRQWEPDLGDTDRIVESLAVDADGNYWIAHHENELRKYDSDGNFLFALRDSNNSGHPDVDVREGQFVYLHHEGGIRVYDFGGELMQNFNGVYTPPSQCGIAVDDSGLIVTIGNLTSEETWINYLAKIQDDSSADIQRESVFIDSTPPAAVIASPSDGATIDGHDSTQVQITGTADDPEFHHYLVEWANAGDTEGWHAIDRGDVAVNGGTLATWDTSTLTSGDYTIRLTSFDSNGSSNRAEVTISYIDPNPPAVADVTAGAGDKVNGSVVVEGRAGDADVAGMEFQSREAGMYPAGSKDGWTTVGSDDTHPYSAEWDTTAIDNGDQELRAVATDTGGNVGEGQAVTVAVDNAPPSAEITSPAKNAEISGAVNVTASVTGDDIAGVFFEFKPSEDDVWIPVAAIDNEAPYEVEWDTEWLLPDRDYQLRALATDDLGNTDPRPTSITVHSQPPTTPGEVTLQTAAGWHMATIGAPGNAGATLAELLGPDVDRAYTWNPTEFCYDRVDLESATGGEMCGRGTWWLLLEAIDRAVPLADAVPHEVNVLGGWNLLSNPYGSPLDLRTGLLPDGSGSLTGPAYIWDAQAQSYAETGEIPPGCSFWMLSDYAGTATLDPAGMVTASAEPAEMRSLAAPPEVDEDATCIQLVAKGATSSDSAVWLGVTDDATTLRTPKPPMAPNAVGAYLDVADGMGYARSIVPQSAEQTWTLTVNSPGEEETSLRIVDTSELPGDMALWLTDRATGERIDLRHAPSYSYTAREGQRQFEIEIGERVDLLQVMGVSAQSAGDGGQISFTLSAAGSVTVDVLNIAGRTVKRIVADRECDAGPQTVSWNGVSDRGTPVPGGMYLVRVTAAVPTGEQCQGLATMRLR